MSIFKRNPKLDELRQIPLFAALPRRQLDLLARNVDTVEVPAGTEVIRQGERGREFFAIADGEVEIYQDGRQIATERTGEVFGELALVHGIPRTATVLTTAPSRLFVMNGPAFRGILAGSFV